MTSWPPSTMPRCKVSWPGSRRRTRSGYATSFTVRCGRMSRSATGSRSETPLGPPTSRLAAAGAGWSRVGMSPPGRRVGQCGLRQPVLLPEKHLRPGRVHFVVQCRDVQCVFCSVDGPGCDQRSGSEPIQRAGRQDFGLQEALRCRYLPEQPRRQMHLSWVH